MVSSDTAFLLRAAEAAFDLGRDGFHITAIDIPSRKITCADTGQSAKQPAYEQGEPPVPGRQGRREYDWQPAVDAPPWMNMAWLLEDMATWIPQLAEDQVTLTGFSAPTANWCDVRVRTREGNYQIRIKLADRRQTLDFPGMYLRDLFAEARHLQYLVPSASSDARDAQVVDLRDVL
ncbi:hypothetical protein [Streptomyces sp. NRRL B-1347]|uniref:hypothetical protein n=1 Tax=Streptomyces sp. NRRL B-1347 TaxID=1476877 RepID=UPI00068DDAC0|nr:hypothetical protein [Streptomyces sp. NRRL B-1347]